MKLSFVIPCYRSEKTIRGVVDEIREVVSQKSEYTYEIITVNDGSPDNVMDVIEQLCQEDENIFGVNLMKNFGQQNARMAGLNIATGDIVVCLDDDGQCPVDKLWDLIAPLLSGQDCAIAKYPHKQQSGFKNFGSRINSMTTHWLLDMPKDLEMSNFFAFKQIVCRGLIQYKNPYPFSSGLILRVTTKIVNIVMEERERISGSTGYTLKKLLALWANGLTSFSVKPLRIADFLGMICAMIGCTYGLYTVIQKILNPAMQAGYASTIAIILFIGGCLMILLGLIGEYVGRIFICLNQCPQFIVREVINQNMKGVDDES